MLLHFALPSLGSIQVAVVLRHALLAGSALRDSSAAFLPCSHASQPGEVVTDQSERQCPQLSTAIRTA